MADWKEVRKEARSRDDRRQSSELHRNIRSRSSTPGSDSHLKHSAHMERERREPSSSHLKRKRRRSSSSRSRSPSGDRKDKSRKSVKSKKGKRDCNSSECTRHVTGATKSEHKHRKRKRKYSSPSSDSSSDSNSSDIHSSGSSVERRRKKKHMKREKHSHRLKKSARKKHKLKSKRKKRSKTDSGRVVSPAEAGIEGPHVLSAKPKQQELSTSMCTCCFWMQWGRKHVGLCTTPWIQESCHCQWRDSKAILARMVLTEPRDLMLLPFTRSHMQALMPERSFPVCSCSAALWSHHT